MSPVETALMVVAMTTVVVIMTTQVILRYVFNESLSWAEELVRYVVVWMSFLGAGMGIARGAHIVMGLAVGVLPVRFAAWAVRAGHVGALVFSVFLFVAGGSHVLTVMGFGQVSSAMRAPMWIVYLCLPIGAVLFFVRLVEAFLRTFLPREPLERDGDMLWTGGT